jgi:hypothetical protein
MADIFIRCPSIGCRQVLTVASECRGLLVTCRFCKRMIRIPQERRDGRAPAQTLPAGTLPAGTLPVAAPAVTTGAR